MIVATSCVATFGCHSDHPDLAEVAAKVTIDGKPLGNGTITFESEGHRPAIGRIVDGSIVEITTYEPGDGVPVGHHKVAISSTEQPRTADPGKGSRPGEKPIQASNYMLGRSLIPSRYNSPGTSGLTADIESGKNSVEFELDSKP